MLVTEHFLRITCKSRSGDTELSHQFAQSLPSTLYLTADLRCSVVFQHKALSIAGSTEQEAVTSNDHVMQTDRQHTFVSPNLEIGLTKLEYWISNGGPRERDNCSEWSTEPLESKLELLSTPLSSNSNEDGKERALLISWLTVSDIGTPRSEATAAIWTRMTSPGLKPVNFVSCCSGGNSSPDHLPFMQRR